MCRPASGASRRPGAGRWPGLLTFPTRRGPGRLASARPAWRSQPGSARARLAWPLGGRCSTMPRRAQGLKRRATAPREQARDVHRPLRVGLVSSKAMEAVIRVSAPPNSASITRRVACHDRTSRSASLQADDCSRSALTFAPGMRTTRTSLELTIRSYRATLAPGLGCDFRPFRRAVIWIPPLRRSGRVGWPVAASDFRLLGDLESVIDLDVEVPHGGLQLGVPE